MIFVEGVLFCVRLNFSHLNLGTLKISVLWPECFSKDNRLNGRHSLVLDSVKSDVSFTLVGDLAM